LANPDESLFHVVGRLDVVSFEDRLGLVAGDLHCSPAVHTSLNQVTGRASAEVVRDEPGVFFSLGIECPEPQAVAGFIPLPSNVLEIEHRVVRLRKRLAHLPQQIRDLNCAQPSQGYNPGSNPGIATNTTLYWLFASDSGAVVREGLAEKPTQQAGEKAPNRTLSSPRFDGGE
jgi:hypothetical protein